MTRVVRLAFLAPDIVEAIVAGRQAAGIDAKALVQAGSLPIAWTEQKRLLELRS